MRVSTRWAATAAIGCCGLVLSTAGTPAGAATTSTGATTAVGPDLALSYQVLSGPNPTTDDKLVYEYFVTNVGTAPAVGARLDVKLSPVGPGTTTVIQPVAVGCHTVKSGGRLPETDLECPLGLINPGNTVATVLQLSVDAAGRYDRPAFANSATGADANTGNDGVVITTVVGQGSGSGPTSPSLLDALVGLVQDLLGVLHL